MAAVNYPVVGAPKPSPAPVDGSVPLRLELRALQKNADQWNLYLLGLDAFKNGNEGSDVSYYMIAGIHGRPYRPWGSVKGQNVGGWQGYCTHTSILFAPWHRPYLALYEQVLYKIIQQIAAQFPDNTRARYQAAAATFRAPYWDWAAVPENGDYFPDAVGGSNTVQVISPTSNGAPLTINNPLYSFKFHPLNPVAGDFRPMGRTPFDKWPETLRYPSSTTSVNATSEQDQAADAMNSQFSGLQQNVNILLTDPNYTDFAAFSNHEWEDGDPGTFASLEDVHNSIHGTVGGFNGHMSQLDYSAFDPVFWLHHTNVDRLFSIWQNLNPTSYTINQVTANGTFTTRANSLETADTPLTPFADSTGTKYWTSTGVKSTLTFNYAYPETQRWNFSNDSDYQNDILDRVQQLYGGLSNQFANLMGSPAPNDQIQENIARPVAKENVPTATNGSSVAVSAHKVDAVPTESPAPEKHGFLHDLADRAKTALSHHHSHTTEGTRGLDLEAEIGKPDDHKPEPKPSTFTEYIVNIKAPKHLLRQAYRVHVFLGEFHPEIKSWQTQEALVGTLNVFGKETEEGATDETACAKCKDDAANQCIVTGTVPLTAQIIDEVKKGNCPSLDKENVLPWLRQNLHWRVTLADGTEKERGEVPGLTLSVVTTDVVIPVHGRPQRSGVYEVHPEVTAGRPAGFGDAPIGTAA